jgi:signal transduction histidine kinase
MFDDYQIPVFLLIAALVVVLAYVDKSAPSLRTRLWIGALACMEAQTLLLALSPRLLALAGSGRRVMASFAISAGAEAALLVSSVLFLTALSPLSFAVGERRIRFAWVYLAPQLIYVALYFGVSAQPSGALLWVFIALAVWAAGTAMAWSLQKGAIPIWLATALVAFASFLSVPFYMHGNVYWPLVMLLAGNLGMMALLVVYTYRRFSPGTVFAALGFLGWGLPALLLIRETTWTRVSPVALAHGEALAKMLLALGLAALVLEEEMVRKRQEAERALRIRHELETYTRYDLAARSLDEFDRDSSRICAMAVEESWFGRAAMLVRMASGSFKLVGYAGMDGATAAALDAMAQRLPAECLRMGAEPVVPESRALHVDLEPWLLPGDDLERLHLTRVCVMPLRGADASVDGALLLAAPRGPVETLRAEELLPLEVLAGRMQMARAEATMLGKLIDSERFAGLGQLASNVAQQLNNPLTVILGYSALLEDSVQGGPERRGVEAISIEARRMKTMLERLSRFSRLGTERFHSFSVTDLIGDVEQLLRTDFLRYSIEFRTAVETGLPEIFGNAHQVRQALLHMVQFAIEAVQRVGTNEAKAIRVEAGLAEGMVRVVLSHTGAKFPYPDRVFDSFSTGFSGSEATGLGLSLCAAIVRDHRGTIVAMNHEPAGASIVIDLPVS